MPFWALLLVLLLLGSLQLELRTAHSRLITTLRSSHTRAHEVHAMAHEGILDSMLEQQDVTIAM